MSDKYQNQQSSIQNKDIPISGKVSVVLVFLIVSVILAVVYVFWLKKFDESGGIPFEVILLPLVGIVTSVVSVVTQNSWRSMWLVPTKIIVGIFVLMIAAWGGPYIIIPLIVILCIWFATKRKQTVTRNQ